MAVSMRSFLFLSLLSFLIPSCVAQVREGSIHGTVLADRGAPVTDAHVSAEVMSGPNIMTVLGAETNDTGVFAFSQLPMGEYRVFAEKQEAGYLSTRPDIFTPKPPLTIALTPSEPTAATTIRLGPKAGMITGWVRDSSTGEPIAAHLSLAPTDGHAWSTTGTTGQFRFQLLIPADTPVFLGACAEGYETWFYADPANRSRRSPLQLRPGTSVEIDVALDHRPDNMAMPCLSSRY